MTRETCDPVRRPSFLTSFNRDKGVLLGSATEAQSVV